MEEVIVKEIEFALQQYTECIANHDPETAKNWEFEIGMLQRRLDGVRVRKVMARIQEQNYHAWGEQDETRPMGC